MTLVIITPILNEKANIQTLAKQLSASTCHPKLWIIVDDGSTDGGGEAISNLNLPFKTEVLRRANKGGLIGGSAFTAWQHGVDYIHEKNVKYDYIMKLDADVELPAKYLESVTTAFGPDIGLVGGVLTGKGNREQMLHVPGPVKMYSKHGYAALSEVPRVVGFDVMDELAIKRSGLRVIVCKDLLFSVRRPIGASQGLVHGRRRNGLVCRWTGYWFPYFILHAIRYFFRKPYLIGSAAMLYGYGNAPKSPYPTELQKMHAKEQQEKLRDAAKAPVTWARNTYGN